MSNLPDIPDIGIIVQIKAVVSNHKQIAVNGNHKGEKVENPFKSSLFRKSVGIETLENRITKSAEIIKNKGLKERSKSVISAAMQTCKNRKDFEEMLSKQSVSVLFRTNDTGRIYGVTFIDHEQKCVFNGSRLGKDFSANVFNDLFKNEKYPSHDLQNDNVNSQPELESGKSFNQENQSSDSIFGLFTFETGSVIADEIEENALTRRMKKRRRRHV